jgi:transposase
MDQPTQFMADYLREVLSITELCAMYGITRKTGYKWIDRYLRQGPSGLEERSRRPQRSPNQTSDEIVAALLEARRHHPSWGGKKLLALLHKRQPRWELPGRSTACDILSRHGLVPRRRQRRRIGVAEQFLHGADVAAVLQEVGRERVAKPILTLPMNRPHYGFRTATIRSLAPRFTSFVRCGGLMPTSL